MYLLMILAGCCTVCLTVGNTVSMSSSRGNVGEPLELTCLLNPTYGATTTSVKWFRDNDANGIHLSAATCNLVGQAESFDLSRYSFTCSSNTFKLKILALQSSDDGQCWSCSVTFTSFPETDKASAACIQFQSNNNILLLMIILMLPIPIIIILICCGCLDCCKCCRTFYHYDKKSVAMSPGILTINYAAVYSYQAVKGGHFWGGCKSKKECYGGCIFCQEICGCGCGCPNYYKLKNMRSCGGCYFICCEEGRIDDDESDIKTDTPGVKDMRYQD